MRACCGRVRWLIFRRSSACMNRCRFIRAAWACWRAITSRALRIWIFRWWRWACFTAKDISGRGWTSRMAAGRVLPTDVKQLPMEPAIGKKGEPVTIQIETRGGIDCGEGLAREGRAHRSAAAGFKCGREYAGRSRADFALVWRRWAGAYSPGIAAGRGRFPRVEGDGDHSGRSASERRAQRVCGAGGDSQPHGGRGREFRSGAAACFARGGVHHAYAGAGGARPV